MICHYCNNEAKKVDGSVIYPHRHDLKHLVFYLCDSCNAYVGTHKDTGKPYGILANKELRKLKCLAHESFDVLWRELGYKRSHAYKLLALTLNIPIDDCHIGMFNENMCKKVIHVVDKFIKEIENDKSRTNII